MEENEKKLVVAYGCDHGGYPYKEQVIKHLEERGYEVIDCGTYSKESCNYPEPAIKTAEMVASKKADYGVLVCNTGEGVSISANKIKGIRCGIAYTDEVTQLLMAHNHCNMIAFGSMFMTLEDVLRRIDIFFNSTPNGGRHERRVQMIIDYENAHQK